MRLYRPLGADLFSKTYAVVVARGYWCCASDPAPFHARSTGLGASLATVIHILGIQDTSRCATVRGDREPAVR